MLIKSVGIFLLSFLINSFLIRFLIDLAMKRRFVKTHENFFGRVISVPSLGGLGIYFTFLIFISLHPSLLFLKITQGILIGGTLIITLGFLDDKIEFAPLTKIIAQFLVVLVLLYFGIKTEIVYLPPFLNLVVTIFWVVVITNALNLLDIMDGLCGGISLIIALTFFVLALIGKNLFVAAIAISLAGSLLAFLRYNFPPAKIFLGNSGSLFLGFIFSVLAISLKYAPSGKHIALFTPLVILALPFYDTFFVALMRFRGGKSIFLKTKDHLAMRFLITGYSEKGTLKRMFILSAGLSLGAIAISLSPDLVGLIVLALLIISLGVLTKNMAAVKVE